LRIPITFFINKLGKFLQNSPVFLLRPSQLKRISKQSYNTTNSAEFWGDKNFVNQGFFPGEKEVFELLNKKKGNLLLLGIGGGREALVLGKAGFNITGVDFVKELLDKAIENGKEAGIEIKGIHSDIANINVDPDSFDVIWYSCSIYSSIPGRKKRIKNLKWSGEMLKSDGFIACFFYWNPSAAGGNLRWKLGKFLSRITFGNTTYEKGDIYKDNLEFLHAFYDKENLISEFDEAGFQVIDFIFPENSNNACALLKKRV